MTPSLIVVHHSAGGDTDEIELRPIRRWHLMRGWRDVGYHRVYERIGGRYEALAGRGLYEVGAHARGYNARSFGVCFVGDYTRSEPPREQLLVAARDIAGICRLAKIPPQNIVGHREVGQTICPGAVPLGHLRHLVSMALDLGFLPQLPSPERAT